MFVSNGSFSERRHLSIGIPMLPERLQFLKIKPVKLLQPSSSASNDPDSLPPYVTSGVTNYFDDNSREKANPFLQWNPSNSLVRDRTSSFIHRGLYISPIGISTLWCRLSFLSLLQLVFYINQNLFYWIEQIFATARGAMMWVCSETIRLTHHVLS